MKEILIAFLAGSLVAGGAVGTMGYFKIKALSTENTLLQEKVKKQVWHQENLNKSQASLTEELNGLKAKKDQTFDQTIGALMQAKDNADIVALYEMGIKALQEKDFPRAYFALDQVQQANPKFKDIQKFYPESKKAYDTYQQQQLEAKLQSTYSQAVDQQTSQQFAQAKLSYQRVLDLNPHYKDARARMYTVSRYLAIRQQTQEYQQKQAWLEATYKLGVNEQSNGRYAQAKEAYQNILAYAPNYKDTARRAKSVGAYLPKTPASTQLVNGQTTGQNLNCYEKGAALGKCASLGSEAANCSQADIARLAQGCKNNPDFAKGLKSTVPGAGPAAAGSANSPASLLRDIPNLMKNL